MIPDLVSSKHQFFKTNQKLVQQMILAMADMIAGTSSPSAYVAHSWGHKTTSSGTEKDIRWLSWSWFCEKDMKRWKGDDSWPPWEKLWGAIWSSAKYCEQPQKETRSNLWSNPSSISFNINPIDLFVIVIKSVSCIELPVFARYHLMIKESTISEKSNFL